MFDISAPYRTRNQVAFAWDADLIVERAFAARNILPSRGGAGIASTRALNDPASLLMVEDGSLRPATGLIRPAVGNANLERQGATVFTLTEPIPGVAAPSAAQTGLGLFRRELLRFQIENVEAFLSMLFEFAGNRKFGTQKMLNIPSIRLRLAEVRQKSVLLLEIIESSDLTNEEVSLFEDIRKLVNELCDLLIRVAGGRAILAGGLIEMKLVFNIANRIYL